MGIDVQAARLLAFAKRAGVDFSSTATLGHQSLHTPRPILKSVFRRMQLDIDASQLARIEARAPYADGVLEVLGANEVVSIDASPYEKASIVHDMNREIPAGLENRFTAVIDGGTLEHVFDFPTAIRNSMRMLRIGGHFLSIAPTNNFMGHGFYQFSPELFYRVFSRENGFEMRHMFSAEVRYGGTWYAVADPMKVRDRVELINSVPTYLLVIAQRVGSGELFKASPQQSDYEQIDWQGAREHANGSESRARNFMRAFAPGWLRDLRESILRKKRTSFASSAFRAVDPAREADSLTRSRE